MTRGHHVVEASVGEVVLDPRPARPRQRAVDHVQLAVLGAPELVLAPIEVAVDEEPVEVELDRVVGDDLGAGAHEVAVHVLVVAVGVRTLVVDRDPHLDTLGELLLQDAGELRADLTGVPSEHQDVDRLGGALDVLDDARVELGALRPRFDRRRGGPRVVEIEVAWSGRAAHEVFGRSLRTIGGDRVGGRWPVVLLGDEHHLPEDQEHEQRQADQDTAAHGSPPRERLADPSRFRLGAQADDDRADGARRPCRARRSGSRTNPSQGESRAAARRGARSRAPPRHR